MFRQATAQIFYDYSCNFPNDGLKAARNRAWKKADLVLMSPWCPFVFLEINAYSRWQLRNDQRARAETVKFSRRSSQRKMWKEQIQQSDGGITNQDRRRKHENTHIQGAHMPDELLSLLRKWMHQIQIDDVETTSWVLDICLPICCTFFPKLAMLTQATACSNQIEFSEGAIKSGTLSVESLQDLQVLRNW